MYSSVVGAITTDVAAMVVPLDDHMVHRGHSVFDTTSFVNGYASPVLFFFQFSCNVMILMGRG